MEYCKEFAEVAKAAAQKRPAEAMQHLRGILSMTVLRELDIVRGSKPEVWEQLFESGADRLLRRLDEWTGNLNKGRPLHTQHGWSKSGTYVPGLFSRPVLEVSELGTAIELQEHSQAIIKEVRDALQKSNIDMSSVGGNTGAHDSTLVTSGLWTDLSLFRVGKRNESTCAILPKTCSIIDKIPEITTNPWSHVLLSNLHPASTVRWHQGSSNTQLTLHLGINIPSEGAAIQVDDWVGGWKEGKVTAFDDTYAHRLWHKGSKEESQSRLILLVRAWHPELTLMDRASALMLKEMKKGEWSAKKKRKTAKKLTKDKEWKERWQKHWLLFSKAFKTTSSDQIEKDPHGARWIRSDTKPDHKLYYEQYKDEL
eukprot:TRINITY_DN14228_c2_g1_i1.p1 TRINITY_DN14228_c2_g1~~TRINITY_DN14228_c2_g1_i1.p1  ORF type:complete len:417 (+),score=64.90 TRINITY_DN14228_c2_g1_i1:150-1253(+)